MKSKGCGGLLFPRSVVYILVRVRFQTRMGHTLKCSIRLECRRASFILLNEYWSPLWYITLYTGLHAINPRSSDSRSTYPNINGPAFPTHREKKYFCNFIHDTAATIAPGPPLCRDTLKYTTFGGSPLDERSASRTDLYITHNPQKRKISMPPAGFEPANPAIEQPLWPALLLYKKLDISCTVFLWANNKVAQITACT